MVLWDRKFSTDAEGRWHVDHVPEEINSMYVGLEHPNYISAPGLEGISAEEQKRIENNSAVMVMKKGIAVSGTVTDPNGKPLTDALVALGEDRFGSGLPSTRTDKAGKFRFANLAPGGQVVTIVKPGLAPTIRNLYVQPDMKPVDFRLKKGQMLRVRIVDKEDKPLEGIRIAPDTWRGYRTLCDTGIAGKDRP